MSEEIEKLAKIEYPSKCYHHMGKGLNRDLSNIVNQRKAFIKGYQKAKEEQPAPTEKEFLKAAEVEAERLYPYDGGGVMVKLNVLSERGDFLDTAKWAFNYLKNKEK